MTPSQPSLLLPFLYCFLITFPRGRQFNKCPETDSKCLTISGNRACSRGFMSACSTPLTCDCNDPCIPTPITSPFVYVGEFVTFKQAMKGCQKMERELVSVHNQQEADDVATLCIQNSNNLCWIGLRRNVNEPGFKWIDGSDSTDYEFPWFVDGRDVSLGKSANVLVDGRSAAWRIDRNCGRKTDFRAPFICGPQRPRSMSQPTLSSTQFSPSTTPQTEITESTHNPTLEPTIEPTIEPTLYRLYDATTNKPTQSPMTRKSTGNPTLEPTKDPTTEPTGNPTLEPTGFPTTSTMTGEPTGNPTLEPTIRSFEGSTLSAISDQALNPLPNPMRLEQTGNPAVYPTNGPTTEPTLEPTKKSSDDSTLSPTMEPTLEPTEMVTANTVTGEPTVNPTLEPTARASDDSTLSPTLEPTSEPTFNPISVSNHSLNSLSHSTTNAANTTSSALNAQKQQINNTEIDIVIAILCLGVILIIIGCSIWMWRINKASNRNDVEEIIVI